MELILSAVSTLIVGVLAFIIKGFINDNKEEIKKQKEDIQKNEQAMQQGITSLLRVQLIDYHEKYIKLGSIPSYAYENWEKMFAAYTALGGNGLIVHMNEDVRELDIKKTERK